MSEYIEVIVSLLLVFVVFGFIIVREKRKTKRFLLARIRRSWGQAPERQYSYEEFESISHYVRARQGDAFMVDDITWNDLDMDRIFMLMNNTASSCGEDYLYALLRKPLFSREQLDRREKLVDFYRTHEEKRVEMQVLLSQIGKTPAMSISDYISNLQDAPRTERGGHILHAFLAVAAIGTLFIQPVFGALALILVMVINIATYYNAKGEIEIYLRCVQCILRVLKVSDKLVGMSDEETREHRERIDKGRKGLSAFRRGSFLVITTGMVGGGIESAILDYVKMLFHVDLIKFDSMIVELGKHTEDVELLLEGIGILDSAIAIASFREYLPISCTPQLVSQDRAFMEVSDLYHPLLVEPVANSINVHGGTLVTGSNASGKSTFLKNVAINAILAQTCNICVASSYRASFLRVMTSMAMKDDLESGESYYIVEIKSLKRILDAAEQRQPLLCIIDEVLRGTNTIERIAASSRILAALDMDHVLPFAATHDIELTHILEKRYTNVHFEEEVREDDIVFNYLLKPGRATTRNAILLLQMLHFPDDVVTGARKQAEDFEENGVWNVVEGRS